MAKGFLWRQNPWKVNRTFFGKRGTSKHLRAPDLKRGLGRVGSQRGKNRRDFEDLVRRNFEVLEDLHKLAGGGGAPREELVAVAAVTAKVEGHLVGVDALEFFLGDRGGLFVFLAGRRKGNLKSCCQRFFLKTGIQCFGYGVVEKTKMMKGIKC